jgi:hypothetical protein
LFAGGFLVRTLDERRRAAGTYSDSGIGCNLEARELAFVKRAGSPRWKRIHALDVGLGALFPRHRNGESHDKAKLRQRTVDCHSTVRPMSPRSQ